MFCGMARAQPWRLRPSLQPIADLGGHISLSAFAFVEIRFCSCILIGTAQPVVRGVVVIVWTMPVDRVLRCVSIFRRRESLRSPAVPLCCFAFTPSRFVHHLAQSWYVGDSCSR